MKRLGVINDYRRDILFVTTQPTGGGGVQKMVSLFFEHPPSREDG
jgi:hypothetical protein